MTDSQLRVNEGGAASGEQTAGRACEGNIAAAIVDDEAASARAHKNVSLALLVEGSYSHAGLTHAAGVVELGVGGKFWRAGCFPAAAAACEGPGGGGILSLSHGLSPHRDKTTRERAAHSRLLTGELRKRLPSPRLGARLHPGPECGVDGRGAGRRLG